jgi:hypothetical protein
MPDIKEMADPRIEFIACKFSPPPQLPPSRAGRARDDKSRKRIIIGFRVSEFGAGYYMDLDADDLIHRDLVATALATRHGCIITTGYICDAETNLIAPMPGVLSVDFDRICGSMSVLYYEPQDFPTGRSGDVRYSHFTKSGNHGYLRGKREEIGRPLAIVPYPAAIYVINSQENLSFIDDRRDEHGSQLVSRVRALTITDEKKLQNISEEFGWIRG